MDWKMSSDSPPYAYVHEIHLHCPFAAETYDYLWERRDDEYFINVEKSQISNEFFMPYDRFMTDLRDLGRMKLINFWEADKMIKIEMLGWDDWSDEEVN